TTRSDVLPDIPTLGEFVPGYEASQWFGVGAPKNTPSQIIDKLNEAINAGLADPKIKARLAELGGAPFVGSPPDFGKLIADDSESGARSSGPSTSRRTEADPLSIFHNLRWANDGVPGGVSPNGLIQNVSSGLLISQEFSPRSVPNKHLQGALRTKSF